VVLNLPAGRFPQEQVGPVMVFSAGAFSQLQSPADCLPQEHLACVALDYMLVNVLYEVCTKSAFMERAYQIQPELLLPQHVLDEDIFND